MTKEVITGSEALMRALRDEGVKTIFGYPGGAIMPVFDALYGYTRGENKTFNHILVRHEQAAAHAAEGTRWSLLSDERTGRDQHINRCGRRHDGLYPDCSHCGTSGYWCSRF